MLEFVEFRMLHFFLTAADIAEWANAAGGAAMDSRRMGRRGQLTDHVLAWSLLLRQA